MEIHEILKAINATPSKEKQAEIFNQYKDNLALRFILQGAYDDRIASYLPEGSPPFNQFDLNAGKIPVSLLTEEKTIYNFFRHTLGSKQPILQQERAFIQLLESVDPEDADVLIRMKDKNLHEKYKRITKARVKELLKPWVPELT
jgi:hypothetical protein